MPPAAQPPRALIGPGLALFLLAPAIGELLSGSSPPAEFFQPISLLVLGILYGGGALLVREQARGWGKGWPTIVALGAAYGILEEGLMVKSFFDPEWMDLGRLGEYGRWGGVNVIWAAELTVYHAVVSIALPILLVSLAFPDRRGDEWVGHRARRALGWLLLANVAFGFLFLTAYRPPLILYLLAIGAVAGLVRLARSLPERFLPGRRRAAAGPVWLFVAAAAGVFGFFFISWALPGISGFPAPLVLVLLLVWVAAVGAVVRGLAGDGAGWGARHELALAAGTLAFFLLFAPLQELDPNRTDNTAGMTWVALLGVGSLIWLAWRVHRAPPRAFAPADP